jgi:hypothetical protein
MRCRGAGAEEPVWIAFLCDENDSWTLHSRDEGLLEVVRQAPQRGAPYLAVEDVEGLPIVGDRITIFQRPPGG